MGWSEGKKKKNEKKEKIKQIFTKHVQIPELLENKNEDTTVLKNGEIYNTNYTNKRIGHNS